MKLGSDNFSHENKKIEKFEKILLVTSWNEF